MKRQTRPIVLTLDELQQLLDVEHPGDLPDAVRKLKAQAESAAKMRQAIDGLLEKLVENEQK